MRRFSAGLGVVVAGLLGWAPVASATKVVDSWVAAPWVIEVADYTGEVKEQIARLEARYTIRLIRDGWVEIPLAIQGATITAIELDRKAGEAHIMPRGGSYVLAANRKGAYTVRVKCSTLLVQDSQFEGVQLGIPRATFSTMSLAVPRKEVELRPADQLYVESRPDGPRNGVTLTARLAAADRIDLRWRTKPAAPVKVEPVLYGEVHTLVTVEEQLARLVSIIEYRMAQGETKSLELRLPAGVNVLNVRGTGIDDWRVADSADHKTLAVTLSFTLKDTAYRLIVEGEEPIKEAADAYALPAIVLSGVKQERGYLAVSRSGSVELSPKTAEGINRVDVKELPEMMASAAGSPVMLAFKYHQHPYRAALTLTRHQDHAVLAAIAERGELVTVLSRQGELLTRASYLIKANKKQFLEMALPDGATLWSCLVAGTSVKPVEGTAGKLLVPLDATTDSAAAVPVELVYFERRPELVRIGQLTLQGPVLDVPTTVANWLVFAPRDVKFLRMSGNLERGAALFDFLDEPFVQLAAAEPLALGMLEEVGRKAVDAATLSASREALQGNLMERDEEKPYDSLKDDRVNKRARFKANDLAAARSVPFSNMDAKDELREVEMSQFVGRLKESGILPLKIRLPKSGTVYRFNRLMTTNEALTLHATFVHLPLPWLPFAALGLLLAPIGGLALVRVRRR